MATFTKTFLSELPQGGHKSLASGNVLVHRTLASSTVIDEVWLYLQNTSSSEQTVEVYDGSPTAEPLIFTAIAPRSGLVLFIPGLPFSGDGTTGQGIVVLPSVDNFIQATGYVNRITP